MIQLYGRKNALYIGYDENADELIITGDPKAKTAGYFINSGTAILLRMRDYRPVGLSFLFMKDFFKRHKRTPFAKIPLEGKIRLPSSATKRLPGSPQ